MPLSEPEKAAPNASSATAALLLMAASAVLFATMNVFARLATESTSWASVAAVRAVVGALVAFGVARLRKTSLAAVDKWAIFWRSVFGTGAMLATFYALSSRTLSLGDTVTLLNLTPVFLAVLAPIVLRERTSPSIAFAIALALVGVILVLHPARLFSFGREASAPASNAMVAGPSALVTGGVAVLAAVLTSIAMMMLRRAGKTESAEAIAFHFSLFAAATHAVVAVFDPRLPTARDAAFMVAAGLCAGFAQIAMTRAYALQNAARVSAMSYLSVVASALLGAGLLGETPKASAIAGMAFVIVGGLIVTFGPVRPVGATPRSRLLQR
ncbi:Membrane protein [Labilithrix luteola]|uniref:Membrane protein n=1 Tax=Labilithrix luteola TaxID=1391654 RepID=A0A0K1Q0Y5_9BACT|nr:Membrane protein [Labilithrix luteola]